MLFKVKAVKLLANNMHIRNKAKMCLVHGGQKTIIMTEDKFFKAILVEFQYKHSP